MFWFQPATRKLEYRLAPVLKICIFFCGFVTLVSFLTEKAAKIGRRCFVRSGSGLNSRQPRAFNTIVILVVSGVLTVGGVETRAEDKLYNIDIPQQNAAQALNQLAEQTSAILLFPFDLVATRRANAVVGRYSLLDALDLLLKGTGLTSGLSQKSVIQISESELNTRNHKDRERTMLIRNTAQTKLKRRGLLGALMAAFSIGSVSTAGAQTSSVDNAISEHRVLEEILVTASKREAKLQDLPISIYALTESMLEISGIDEIGGLRDVVAGFEVVGSRPGTSTAAMRGVSNVSTGSPQFTSSVGYYLDEVPLSTLNGQSPDFALWDVERVEVLRGPQGTLFGEGSMGGTLRVITNKPNPNETEGRFGASMESIQDGGTGWNVQGMLNLPLVEDELAVRVMARTSDADGWIDIPAFNAKDANTVKQSDIRVATRWLASDELTIDMSYMWSDIEFGAALEETEDGIYAPSLFGFVLPLGAQSEGTNKHQTANLTLDYDFGGFSLVAATSWFKQESFNLSDSTQPSAAFLGLAPGSSILGETSNNAEIFAQEIRLVSDTDGRLDWTVGVFYKDVEFERQVTIDYTFTGGPFGAFGNAFDIQYLNPSDALAIFGEIDFALTDTVSLQMGLRYYEEDREANFISGFDPLFNPGSGMVSATSDDSAVSPAFSVHWEVTESTSLFARAAKGFRGGGVNIPPILVPPGIAIPDFPQGVGPEELWSYELGFKSNLTSGVSLNAYLYYVDWSDLQLVVNCCFNFHNWFENLSSAESYGAEMELFAMLPIEGLNLTINAAYTETEIKESVSDEVFGVTVREGAKIPMVPDWKWFAALDYNRPLSDSLSGRFRMSWSHRGESHTTPANNPAEINQKSDQLGLSLGLLGEEWTLDLFADNLLDERNTLQLSQLPAPLWSIRVPIKPRVVGIRFTKEF